LTNKIYKIISVSGFGWSGSGAVVDLLKEIKGIKYFPYEFRILKDPDGIIDLEHGLVNNWQELKSDITIRRFLKYAKILGRKPKFYYPLSYNYNYLLNNNFFNILNKYLEQLVDLKWHGSWPHHYHEFSSLKWFFYRVFNRLHLAKYFIKKDKMYLSCPKEIFYDATKEFFNNIAKEIDLNSDSNTIFFDQLIPPYNCHRYLKYFHDPKIFIIDRDPRDVYVEALNWSYIPTDNVNDFIIWYKTQREYFFQNLIFSDRILYLKYEDIILKYDEMLKKIYSFLNINPEDHIHRKKFLNPDISKKNIGKWKYIDNNKVIKQIESHLKEYCYLKADLIT